jgi:hypothetical protein
MSANAQYMLAAPGGGSEFVYLSSNMSLGSLTSSTGATGLGITGQPQSGYALLCGPTSGGIIAYSTKTFVIDHPTNENKYLVHACLEGPEGGVYYRGKATITNNESTIIELPSYVSKLASEFTIQLTPILNRKHQIILGASEIINNTFTVYGENCSFYWLVIGQRCTIEVEPHKSNVDVKGDGPYKWI